ncbi:hypothetical protein EB796_007489 [Bugula neritina]|uniref:Uncharacterized protein n=1 Tax=Bugula neritina TaxID=10212 RepID=A0A7J7K9C5_BUGNE|nr:hypothetical protein EB796_007489 [Bugula neritina]
MAVPNSTFPSRCPSAQMIHYQHSTGPAPGPARGANRSNMQMKEDNFKTDRRYLNLPSIRVDNSPDAPPPPVIHDKTPLFKSPHRVVSDNVSVHSSRKSASHLEPSRTSSLPSANVTKQPSLTVFSADALWDSVVDQGVGLLQGSTYMITTDNMIDFIKSQQKKPSDSKGSTNLQLNLGMLSQLSHTDQSAASTSQQAENTSDNK